ncbi:MAG: sensor histidine kinase [Saprospiraceae bacterium]|nr:sensor histidine kinase [Saprospiraceae bacterium]
MKKTSLTLLWAFCLTPLSILAQVRYKPDSLLQVLPTAQGRERIELLRHLSRAFIGSNTEKAVGYAKESVLEAEKLGNDTFIVRSLNNLASALQNSGDRRNSLPYLDRAIEIARKNGNQIQLLESLEFKATAYAGMKQTDKALPLAQEALSISATMKDSVGILNAMEIIAAAHKDLRQYAEAERVYRQEIELLKYLPKRLFEKGRVYVNLGEVIMDLGKPREAVALFQQGKEAFEQFGYPAGALIATIDLANGLMESLEFESARKSYEEILRGNESIGDPEINALAHTGLGVIAMQNRTFEVAKNHYLAAEKDAGGAELYPVLEKVYGHLNELYCLMGDYPTARIYGKKEKNCADSVLTADVRDRLSELQVQYETAEKELKIAQQKSELYRTSVVNYGLSGSLLAILILGYLFYNRFKLRKKAELDAAVIAEQKLGLNAVIEAQEAERKRIARDLHDGIAQELVALKLGFDALGRKMSKIAPEESARFAELGEQLDQSCTEVRSISHIMSPPTLEQQGLAPSLELLLKHTLQYSGINTQFKARDIPLQLEDKVEIGLYRITQELLNNIVKHARAAKVMVELYMKDNQLILQVEDDGIGFDIEAARSRGTMGVLNILSRVSTLGGAFLTEHRNPQGTIAIIKVPV